MVVAESVNTDMPIFEQAEMLKPDLIARQDRINKATEAAFDIEEAEMRLQPGYPLIQDEAMPPLTDVRNTKSAVISPRLLKARIPLTIESAWTTYNARHDLYDIYSKQNNRLAVALGECAVYNPELTLENTALIAGWQRMFPNLLLMQRTFFEKPRTPRKKGEEMPWKGVLYDPNHDQSDDINKGLIAARLLVVRITDTGVPIIKEQLNAVTPQYTDDAVTQDNIGARNARDQKSMEYGSATSAHLANKNSVEGDIEVGVQASASSQGPHTFLGIDGMGFLSRVAGMGNPWAHVLLRGGDTGPNYSGANVEEAVAIIEKYNMLPVLAIDASHGNSGKVAANQAIVVADVSEQIATGQTAIRAVHMETNVVAGNQSRAMGQPIEDLATKQSITDECAGPDETKEMLANLDEATAKRGELLGHKITKARRN